MEPTWSLLQQLMVNILIYTFSIVNSVRKHLFVFLVVLRVKLIPYEYLLRSNQLKSTKHFSLPIRDGENTSQLFFFLFFSDFLISSFLYYFGLIINKISVFFVHKINNNFTASFLPFYWNRCFYLLISLNCHNFVILFKN